MEQIIEQKVSELFKKANEKYYDKDYSEACDLYQRILKIEQIGYESMIYMIFCIMRSLSINDFVNQNGCEDLAKYQVNITNSLDNIKNRIGKNNRAYIESWLNIYRDLIDVIIACHSNAVSYYQKVVEAYTEGVEIIIKSKDSVPYSQLQRLRPEMDKLEQNCHIAQSHYEIITRQLIIFNNLITLHIIETIEDYSLISSAEVQEIFDSVVKIFRLDGKGVITEKIQEDTKGLLYSIQCVRTKAKDFEIEKYWKDKPERKKELEDMKKKYSDERIEIQLKIEGLKRDIEKLNYDINKPLEIALEREKLIKDQKSLFSQKNSLGLFKGKEKAYLQSQIDEIQVEINQLDTKINDEKSKLKDKYQPTIDEKNQKIKELEKDEEQLKQKEDLIKQELYLEED